jgi:TRAP transporter TAXI family solute receptor
MLGGRIAALAVCLGLGAVPGPAATAAAPEQRLALMGTGVVAGVYYPVGVALCRLVNDGRAEHGLRCSAQPSEGSLANIAALREGAIALAIVQSDVQADALAGEGPFADAGAFEGLRSVMSLHGEPLTIVARADAGIAGLEDLAGKRVALGSPGSGTRALADALIDALGWTAETFAATPDIGPARAADALCGGEIDAFLYAVGHPALAIQEVTAACDVTLVGAAGPAVDALVASDPALTPATIPGGLYRGVEEPVETFGVRATVVTRADVPDDVIGTIVAGVFDDLPTLRSLHPALAHLDPQAMASEGLSAPLHPGAERYFRERGLID